MRECHNSTKKDPISGTFSEIDLEIDNYAKSLGKFYEARLSKAERLKDIKETKSLIERRRKARAVLLEGQPGPYEFRVIANLEEQIAHLSTLLPKRGRPEDDLLGLYVTDLANFVKKKTGKYRWELIGEKVAKHVKRVPVPEDVLDPRLWAYRLAKRFWRDCKGPTEIIIKLAPAPPPPSTNPLPKPENEDRKILH
jgi:hypothetical protein